MKILLASSEVFPFSKTGGLADVAGSLPKSFAKEGHEVYIVTPLYRTSTKNIKPIKNTKIKLKVNANGKTYTPTIFEGKLSKNTKVFLIGENSFFDREGLYGNSQGDWPDNLERFSFFSLATLELCKALKIKPNIIHCHDWQSALIPVYLKTKYKKDVSFSSTTSVFTIHNLSYQGHFPKEKWSVLGLNDSYFTPDYLEFWGKINLMKGGIIFSDSITTVSSKYAQEIKTPEFGCGLEGVLKKYNYKLTGIINGVDYDDWDPSKDPFIISNYSRRSITGKPRCKESLQEKFALPIKPSIPLIGMISRLIEQKGFDTLIKCADEIFSKNLQLVILGKGEEHFEKSLSALNKKYPDKMGLMLAYDNKLAHKIEAGADMFLMPSKFEPCGLNQMYSLKYGTIPIVTPLGGLDDTIKDYDEKSKQGNGFKTKDTSEKALLDTIDRAINIYHKPSAWKKVTSNAMACDYSWEKSAEQYLKLFEIIGKNTATADQNTVVHIHPQKELEA